jgi:hypothetical protein
MRLQWLYPLFRQDAHANASVSSIDCDTSPSSVAAIKSGEWSETDFRFGDGPAQSLSALERQRFIADFEDAANSLHAWSLRQGWGATAPRNLRVLVSSEFRISRALVPAWEGRSGTIEFPARRVVAGRAAIVHELAHVFFPSGNRLLAEGLAIYLQALLGRNPAFPNFSQPLHAAARDHVCDVLPAFAAGDTAALEAFSFASLDAIPTPNPLTLEIEGRFCGEDKDGQATLYCLAGSFVQFLIDVYGLALLRHLYIRTPLRVGELDAGPVNRWHEVYGRSLADLEDEWKSVLASTWVPSRAFA